MKTCSQVANNRPAPPTVEQGGIATLLLTCLAVALSMACWFSSAAIAPQLADVWSLSATETAALTTTVQIGFVCGALSSSLLNLPDIVRMRWLMGASAAIAAIANAAFLLEPSFPVALACRFLTGMALAGVYPPSLKLTSGWFEKSRGLALGAVIAALTLGSALPHLIRGLTHEVAWSVVVLLSSLLTMGGAALFALRAREGPFAAPTPPFDPSQIWRLVGNRPLMLVNLGYFGHMWELYAFWALFAGFAADALPRMGLSRPDLPAIVTFCVVASGIVGALAGGYMADRIGRAFTASIMLAISGSCAILTCVLYGGPAWAFLVVACLWGASVIGDSAQFSALATEVGDKRYIGTALTLQLGIGFAVSSISIQCTSYLATRIGWHWSFLLLVPGPVVGIWAMKQLVRCREFANG